MLRLVEILDEQGTFAAAVVGALALMSMPITYGGEYFEASTIASIIAVASLLIAALLRFSVWALENIRETLYLVLGLAIVLTLESFLIWPTNNFATTMLLFVLGPALILLFMANEISRRRVY
jgi:hypothetical protein